MNDLSTAHNEEPTMSSREIAELTGKKHSHVLRDIRAMIPAVYDVSRGLDIRSYRWADASPDDLSRHLDRVDCKGIMVETREDNGQIKAIHLDRYHTEVLVTGYDVRRRAAVIRRWYDLESGQATPAANEPTWVQNLSSQARIAIADLNSQVETLSQEKERLNSVCNDLAENLQAGITPVQFCRQLNGVNTQKVQGMLVDMGHLIATRHGYRSPSQNRDRLFKERRTEKGGTTYEQVLLTRQGAKWLYSLYEKNQLPMKRSWDGRYSHEIYEPGLLGILDNVEGV